MLRKKYILGNWKLNKNLSEITKFFAVFNKFVFRSEKIVYGFAPTHLGLAHALNLKKGQTIIMAQDVSEKIQGSYTGQISCYTLKDLDVKYVIVGHSETRQYLGCTDELVNAKVLTCLSHNITPVICIGESLKQYENKQTKQVLTKQLTTIFNTVRVNDATKCIIAYEPLWAIGSGKTPTLKEISDLCEFIRSTIKKLFNDNVAKQLPILYGGSVNESNALEIISLPNVDGSLIGGASLDPIKFNAIVKDIKQWTSKK